MIIPLNHERMTLQRLPWVTIAIIALNVVIFLVTRPLAQRDYARTDAVYLELEAHVMAYPGVLEEDCLRCAGKPQFDELTARWERTHLDHIFSRFGYVPAQPKAAGLLGSLFLHAGFMHLLGNMYLLWLCGCSIEDVWGRPLYAAVYVTGGVGAALAHGAFQPESLAHLIGASGAVAALMGVFLVRCHDTRIRFFYWFLFVLVGTFFAPAWIMLMLWFTRELFYAFVFAGSSSVAFWAHIGGFGFGAAVAGFLKLTRIEEHYIAPAIDRKTDLLNKHPRFSSAVEHVEQGDYQRAIGELKIAATEDRDDPDLYRLLAQCYQSLDQPTEAARWLRQEMALHARRREASLVAETYHELVATTNDVKLTPRELSSAASALMETGDAGLAVPIYEELVDTAPEPLVRLRAGLTLVDFFSGEGQTRRAVSMLERVAPLAAAHPEWAERVEDKRTQVRASVPSA